MKRQLVREAGPTCPLCGIDFDSRVKDKRRSFHHVVPKRKGGLNSKDNMKVICQSCHTDINEKEGIH